MDGRTVGYRICTINGPILFDVHANDTVDSLLAKIKEKNRIIIPDTIIKLLPEIIKCSNSSRKAVFTPKIEIDLTFEFDFTDNKTSNSTATVFKHGIDGIQSNKPIKNEILKSSDISPLPIISTTTTTPVTTSVTNAKSINTKENVNHLQVRHPIRQVAGNDGKMSGDNKTCTPSTLEELSFVDLKIIDKLSVVAIVTDKIDIDLIERISSNSENIIWVGDDESIKSKTKYMPLKDLLPFVKQCHALGKKSENCTLVLTKDIPEEYFENTSVRSFLLNTRHYNCQLILCTMEMNDREIMYGAYDYIIVDTSIRPLIASFDPYRFLDSNDYKYWEEIIIQCRTTNLHYLFIMYRKPSVNRLAKINKQKQQSESSTCNIM